MDEEIFEALEVVMDFAFDPKNQNTALWENALKVAAWMDEIEKEIEDVRTLGTDQRPPLTKII